jgi:hypothetical protein
MVRTTARLVRTESANQQRVIGGICVTHASIPTGMSWLGVLMMTNHQHKDLARIKIYLTYVVVDEPAG